MKGKKSSGQIKSFQSAEAALAGLQVFRCERWRCLMPARDCVARRERARRIAGISWKNIKHLEPTEKHTLYNNLGPCLECRQGEAIEARYQER